MGRGRQWTDAEYEQLCEEWGRYSIPTIAERHGRSENAIKIKVQRLQLGSFLENSQFVTVNQLVQEFGHSSLRQYFTMQLREAGFPFKRQRVGDNRFLVVDIEEFWKWVKDHRALFDFSKLQKNALGCEPEWVAQQRCFDAQRRREIKPHNAAWTPHEDDYLRMLLSQYKYTYAELKKMLKRSEGAIQKRVLDLGIKERPLKAEVGEGWTDADNATLADMICAGANYFNISEAIGKSEKAIRGHVYAMYMSERLDKVRGLIAGGRWGNGRPERVIGKPTCLNAEDRREIRTLMSSFCGILVHKIKEHYADSDFWQKDICRHWDDRRGCTVDCTDCDACVHFERIRPQYCVRCGATFFERQENRICAACRTARKKQYYRKVMRMRG